MTTEDWKLHSIKTEWSKIYKTRKNTETVLEKLFQQDNSLSCSCLRLPMQRSQAAASRSTEWMSLHARRRLCSYVQLRSTQHSTTVNTTFTRSTLCPLGRLNLERQPATCKFTISTSNSSKPSFIWICYFVTSNITTCMISAVSHWPVNNVSS